MADNTSGRTMSAWTRTDGTSFSGMLEWTAGRPDALAGYIRAVQERVPIDGNRREEAHTLRIDGVFRAGGRTALVYRCPWQPTTLRDVLVRLRCPSADDRRRLCRLVVSQARSLHVHFDLVHAALRPESFVFFGGFGGAGAAAGAVPDLTRPFVLDWARDSSPDLHQHPQFQPGRRLWFYQVWSLLMILTEIAEWRPLDRAFPREVDLWRRRLERKQLATNPDWQGEATARLFQYGFGFIDRDPGELERYSHWQIKRFYDTLCDMLGNP